jgi:DNA polymerase-3 subunit delta
MPPVRALDILAASAGFALGDPSLVILHGGDAFLVRESLGVVRSLLCPDEHDRAWAWREFIGGDEFDPRDVFDEAATVPMFAGATRAAVVRNADQFVSAHRARLETLADAPRRAGRGLVILEVKSFPSTTRLAKAVDRHGLAIDTAIPATFDLAGWVRGWARSRHDTTLAAATAQRLVERLGPQLGLIDQALARLAAATPADARRVPLEPDVVDTCAGSPQERTAWGMIDAAGAGNAAVAIAQLADLLAAGENPIGIAAQTAAVLRRLSTAARLLALPAGAGRPGGVDDALRQAGVAAWPKALAQARMALSQLGPRRARALPLWLLDLDLALKGDASRGLRARLALERLFCTMARCEDAGGDPTGPRTART